MKIALLPIALLLSFALLAQDDDYYCTCMETQNQEEEIFDFVSVVNTQLSITLTQNNDSAFEPEMIQEVEEIRIIIPEEEIEDDVEEEEDLSIEKDKNKDKQKIKSQKAKVKSKLKHRKKRAKKRLKKRKKAKKYKGKCPFF